MIPQFTQYIIALLFFILSTATMSSPMRDDAPQDTITPLSSPSSVESSPFISHPNSPFAVHLPSSPRVRHTDYTNPSSPVDQPSPSEDRRRRSKSPYSPPLVNSGFSSPFITTPVDNAIASVENRTRSRRTPPKLGDYLNEIARDMKGLQHDMSYESDDSNGTGRSRSWEEDDTSNHRHPSPVVPNPLRPKQRLMATATLPLPPPKPHNHFGISESWKRLAQQEEEELAERRQRFSPSDAWKRLENGEKLRAPPRPASNSSEDGTYPPGPDRDFGWFARQRERDDRRMQRIMEKEPVNIKRDGKKTVDVDDDSYVSLDSKIAAVLDGEPIPGHESEDVMDHRNKNGECINGYEERRDKVEAYDSDGEDVNGYGHKREGTQEYGSDEEGYDKDGYNGEENDENKDKVNGDEDDGEYGDEVAEGDMDGYETPTDEAGRWQMTLSPISEGDKNAPWAADVDFTAQSLRMSPPLRVQPAGKENVPPMDLNKEKESSPEDIKSATLQNESSKAAENRKSRSPATPKREVPTNHIREDNKPATPKQEAAINESRINIIPATPQQEHEAPNNYFQETTTNPPKAEFSPTEKSAPASNQDEIWETLRALSRVSPSPSSRAHSSDPEERIAAEAKLFELQDAEKEKVSTAAEHPQIEHPKVPSFKEEMDRVKDEVGYDTSSVDSLPLTENNPMLERLAKTSISLNDARRGLERLEKAVASAKEPVTITVTKPSSARFGWWWRLFMYILALFLALFMSIMAFEAVKYKTGTFVIPGSAEDWWGVGKSGPAPLVFEKDGGAGAFSTDEILY